jgi:ATP/ADP translocase
MHAFFMLMYASIMVAYAFKDVVQPERGSLQASYSTTFKPIAVMFENWIIVLVFVFGEMYGSIILSLMFWGFANDICTVDESKRFYPLIGMIGNIALVMQGILLAAVNRSLEDKKGLLLQLSLSIVFRTPSNRPGHYTWVCHGEHLQLDAKECPDRQGARQP